MIWIPRIFLWILATIYLIVGKLLAYIMVPIGIWTKWKLTWITWPWDSLTNKTTDRYFDWWYQKDGHPNHTKLSLWAFQQGGFIRELYWRLRNAFSNGMRYIVPHAESIVTKVTKHGFYQYDKARPYICRVRLEFYPKYLEKRWGRYIASYIGFKVNRDDGNGFTFRPFRIKRIK